MESTDDSVETRLQRIEGKLDQHLERSVKNETAISYMMIMLTGAWAAIAGLFVTK